MLHVTIIIMDKAVKIYVVHVMINSVITRAHQAEVLSVYLDGKATTAQNVSQTKQEKYLETIFVF